MGTDPGIAKGPATFSNAAAIPGSVPTFFKHQLLSFWCKLSDNTKECLQRRHHGFHPVGGGLMKVDGGADWAELHIWPESIDVWSTKCHAKPCADECKRAQDTVDFVRDEKCEASVTARPCDGVVDAWCDASRKENHPFVLERCHRDCLLFSKPVSLRKREPQGFSQNRFSDEKRGLNGQIDKSHVEPSFPQFFDLCSGVQVM